MEAFRYVLKCLLFTMLMITLMQVKVGSASIEAHSLRWLQHSSVAHYVQSAAAGGAMALRHLGASLTDAVKNTASGFNEGAHEKAVR